MMCDKGKFLIICIYYIYVLIQIKFSYYLTNMFKFLFAKELVVREDDFFGNSLNMIKLWQGYLVKCHRTEGCFDRYWQEVMNAIALQANAFYA